MPTASGIQYARHTPQKGSDTVNSTDFSAELCGKVDDAVTDATRHSLGRVDIYRASYSSVRYS